MKAIAAAVPLVIFAILVVAVIYGAVASAFEAATLAWKSGEGKRVAAGQAARPSPWFVRAYVAIEPRRHP